MSHVEEDNFKWWFQRQKNEISWGSVILPVDVRARAVIYLDDKSPLFPISKGVIVILDCRY